MKKKRIADDQTGISTSSTWSAVNSNFAMNVQGGKKGKVRVKAAYARQNVVGEDDEDETNPSQQSDSSENAFASGFLNAGNVNLDDWVDASETSPSIYAQPNTIQFA